jgi:hypothetical protein
MQQALTSSVFRSIAVASVLMALTVGGLAARSQHTRRLALHAVERPDEWYISAWRNGPIPVPFAGKQLIPLTYKTRAQLGDGCRWLVIERLVPMDDGRYFYDYSETLLGCRPGATPYVKTPRTGFVTIED